MLDLSADVLGKLKALLGDKNILTSPEDLISYSFDGTAAMQAMPGCVAFVETAEQVRGVLLLANAHRTPVVTRGSGTGLSGGASLCLGASSCARCAWIAFSKLIARI